MKTTKVNLIAIALCLGVFGCSEDGSSDEGNDDTPTGESFFKFKGVNHTMASTGGLENYGEVPGEYNGTNLDLILVSNANGMENDEDGQDAILRSGNYLDLEMYSSSSEQLMPGQYTYSAARPHPTFSFSDGDYDLDLSETTFGNIVGGEVNVSITNGQYKINFDLLDENENTVSGIFNGQLIMYLVDPD